MSENTTHPSAQELSDFGLGRLPAAAAATVAGHLETCPACQKAVGRLPPDSFLGKVRSAKPGQSSIPRSRSAGLAGAANLPDTAAAPPEGLPPELANYPKYRFVRELGRGGMGVVYQAEQTMMGRGVAIKVISPSVLAHPDALPRFHAEVRAAAKLDHPNIVLAYDAEPVGGLHLLVMEYVEGVNLADLVQRKGPLPVTYACHFIRQAALGLQHAFEQGMVHRDIKPQNLMVTPKGVVKVLDFGLARLRGGGRGLTEMGSFLGTPEYVSPEQASDARTADTRADLYSLGCTLYFLLTGRPPFPEDTAVKVILAHIEKEAPPVQELRPEVPAELGAVVARLLAKDPAQRYQKPVELAQALVPFIKRGTKREGVSLPPLAMPVSGRGTMLGANTSKVIKPRQNPAGQLPAPPPAVENKPAVPFADLVDAAAPPKKEERLRPVPAAPAAWSRRPPVLAGIGSAVLVLGLGIWLLAGIIFKVQTKDGILVIEVNVSNAEVYLNGEKVVVTWDDGGQKAEVHRKPGTYQVEVKKDGFTVHGEKVEIQDGERRILTARLSQAAPPPGDGFVSLFNGKDTTGWKSHPTSKAKWVATDGVLIGSGGTGYLFNDGKNYENFHLRVKAMISDGGNSGVYFRTLFGPAKPVGPCAQIDANSTASDAKTGSLFVRNVVAVPLKESPVNSGEWFMLEVIANGPHLVVKVNGQVTADDDTAPRPDGGQIALEVSDEDTVVKFRTIEIKELPATKPGGSTPAVTRIDPRIRRAYIGPDDGSAWSMDGNELVQHQAKSGVCKLVFGDFTWKDYDFTCEGEKISGREIGLVYRVTGAGHREFILGRYDGTWESAVSVDGGASHRLRERRTAALEPGRWYKLSVRVRGAHGQCFIDDKQVFAFDNDKNPCGAVGLWTWYTAARFRNLRVTDPTGKVLFDGWPELPATTNPLP